jgi:Na+/glutamate symporter
MISTYWALFCLWIQTEQPFTLLFKLENKDLVLELVAGTVSFPGGWGLGAGGRSRVAGGY